VKVDNHALPVYSAGCFGAAVEFLFKLFHVFQLEYPYQLKPVYGFIEHAAAGQHWPQCCTI